MDWDQWQTEDLEAHCEDPHFNVRVLVYQLWIMYCSVYSIYVCRVSASVRIYSMCVCIIHVSIQYVCLYNMYCMYSTLVLWGPTAVNDINTQCTNATSSLRFSTMTSTCRELFLGLPPTSPSSLALPPWPGRGLPASRFRNVDPAPFRGERHAHRGDCAFHRELCICNWLNEVAQYKTASVGCITRLRSPSVVAFSSIICKWLYSKCLY